MATRMMRWMLRVKQLLNASWQDEHINARLDITLMAHRCVRKNYPPTHFLTLVSSV
jgi:hypothetical protein